MKKTLYIVNSPSKDLPINTLSFEDYLRDYPKANEGKIRIINLCDNQHYLSQGYYCSLLAEARGHDVLPNVHVINRLREGNEQGILVRADQLKLTHLKENTPIQLLICMGEAFEPTLQKIADYIYQRYPTPLIKTDIVRNEKNAHIQLSRTSFLELNTEEVNFCWNTLEKFEYTKWKRPAGYKQFRWEMAMLVNPQEASPPSNKIALKRFIKAGAKLGINVSVISANELKHVNQFDALFLRETTAIEHHTYRLAAEAELHGLVVMDDTNSILRCCNKVFLHDAFTYQNVPSLKTCFVSQASDNVLQQLIKELGLPMVLKLPEGSFSKGVCKVENTDQLRLKLNVLFEHSALVLAQEYLYTEFDWRIGVLNGRALYSCRYYMAKNHWQIYNHSSKQSVSGEFETLPTFETPRNVLSAALKASAVVGNGLYGVDIKVHNNKAYVIEVNDNPNIDHGIEDKYLGEELYMQIMSEFLQRLEQRGAR